ncbi:hypothetical protein Rpal_0774 [Rhodopseudomonas palustris TIE-1]|uniref:hypothetical protein n=1 Tax=Rhodopseudomonas palustris TaxID=1076 RepID=UPI0001779632|nr:hypothetical protein [Rhodopseudomonas palustris]ACE99332.1 hypothetical protein Rpal_0774 [Rhodopseudomonas palustris TIE-1]
MDEIDWSQMRGLADEAHWNQFVPTSGGELVATKIRRPGVQNADYMFPVEKVILEHKFIQTEFTHNKAFRARFEAILQKHPETNPLDERLPLNRELVLLLTKPIQRILNKANGQIKGTKTELRLPDWSGVVLFVNDGLRDVRPELVVGVISHVLASQQFSGIDALIYLTNHYVDLPDTPDAKIYWHPLYSPTSTNSLAEFVNSLGRKWFEFARQHGALMDSYDVRDQVDLSEMSVIAGPTRNTRYIGE